MVAHPARHLGPTPDGTGRARRVQVSGQISDPATNAQVSGLPRFRPYKAKVGGSRPSRTEPGDGRRNLDRHPVADAARIAVRRGQWPRGEVSRRRFLEIGERHGYSHRGMAGYYQQLVEATPGYKTRLTPIGRERLLFLRERYGEGA